MVRSYRHMSYLLAIVLTAGVTAGCKKKLKDGTGGSPTPSGSPTATPSPSATVNPRTDLSPSCKRVQEGTGTANNGCKAVANKYLPHMYAAQDALYRTHTNGARQIRDVPAYANAIIDHLDRTYNLCAFWDGQRMMVRDGTNTNEFYRIAQPNRVADPYVITNCTPAQKFPTRDDSKDAYNADPFCPLPRSNLNEDTQCEMANGASSANTNAINSAIDAIIAEQRVNRTFMYFLDGDSRPVWIEKDMEQAYLARVVEKLRERGICAIQDGGQGVSIKSGSNSRSEFWALRVIGQVDEQGRHPIWRKFHSTCYPAEF